MAATLPVGSGAPMIATFVLAADTSLHVPPPRMDTAWVASYGCADLARPPNAPSTERLLLRVVEICSAAGIPLPSSLNPDDDRQQGGPSCPFCPVLAASRGLGPLVWYEFGCNPPRPKGAQHRLIHRVAKCAAGLAIAHRLVRMARDAGRGDALAVLLTPPPDAGV